MFFENMAPNEDVNLDPGSPEYQHLLATWNQMRTSIRDRLRVDTELVDAANHLHLLVQSLPDREFEGVKLDKGYLMGIIGCCSIVGASAAMRARSTLDPDALVVMGIMGQMLEGSLAMLERMYPLAERHLLSPEERSAFDSLVAQLNDITPDEPDDEASAQ